MPGNARPSSSAVRRAPTTTARTASEPQRAQRSAASSRPHHRQTAPAASRSGSDSGPVQCRHRAMVRHLAHASAGRSRAGAPERAPAARPPAPCVRPAAPSTAAGRCARRGRVPARSRCHRARHPRGPGAHHGPRGDQVVRPTAPHQRLRLGGAGIAADQRGAAQLMRPQHRHLAGVRIRRPRLGQAVVAVVPHDHQTKVGDGREHRAAGADDQPRAAAQHRQPAAVPRAGPSPADSATTRDSSTWRMPASRSASTSRWSGTTASTPRPEFTVTAAASASRSAHRSPGTACHTARAARPSPTAARNCSPRPYSFQAVVSTGVAVSGASSGGGFLLDVGVPRRDGQPQHVGPGAGIACGDRVDQAAHLGRQHRLGGDHPVQPAQLADMIGVRTPFEHERIDEPAVEAHPYPHAGLCVIGLLGRDEIVELAVQMRHRQHGQHPSDGFVLGGMPGLGHVLWLSLRPPAVGVVERDFPG